MVPTQPAPESQARVLKTKPEPSPTGAEAIINTSLGIGAVTGALGLFWGAASGIVMARRTPVAYALACGVQSFAQGSTFYGARHIILARHGPVENAASGKKVEASTIGGAISQAAVLGLTRGRASILPATFLGAVFGGGGQIAVNKWTASRADAAEESSGSWLGGKWSPFTKLTDREYENILEEKLLRLDAEIAVIDDNIAALRVEKEAHPKAAAKAAVKTPSNNGQA